MNDNNARYFYEKRLSPRLFNPSQGLSGTHALIRDTLTGESFEIWVQYMQASPGEPISFGGEVGTCSSGGKSNKDLPAYTLCTTHLQTYSDLVKLIHNSQREVVKNAWPGAITELTDNLGPSGVLSRLSTDDPEEQMRYPLDNLITPELERFLYMTYHKSQLAEALYSTWDRDTKYFIPTFVSIDRASLSALRNNPYRSMVGLRGGSFNLAEAYSNTLGTTELLQAIRKVALVRKGIDDALGDGSTMCPVENIVKDMLERGIKNPDEHIRYYTEKGNGRIITDPNTGKKYITTVNLIKDYASTSKDLALALALLSKGTNLAGSEHGFEAAKKSAYSKRDFELNEGQDDVVNKILKNNVVMVQGGPGTGKTTVVDVAIESLNNLFRIKHGQNLNVLIVAPTSKALANIREATGGKYNYMTINAALGAIPVGSDKGDEQLYANVRTDDFNPYKFMDTIKSSSKPFLEADVVIIDEAGMVDRTLMALIISYLRKKAETTEFNRRAEDYRVIFLGDNDQLPSIAPGSSFRDLCEIVNAIAKSGKMPAAVGQLTETRRFGIAHQEIAKDILNGIPPSPTNPLIEGDENTFLKMYSDDDESDESKVSIDQRIAEDATLLFKKKLDAFFSERLSHPVSEASVDELLVLTNDFLTKTQVITPVNGGICGTASLNKELHSMVRDILAPFTGETKIGSFGSTLFPGAKVICKKSLQNKVFNGDVGYVTRISQPGDKNPYADVLFNSGATFRIDAKNCNSFKLGYAQTYHATQGDEYDEVIMTLPKSAQRMCTNNLFYTGFTRVKEGIYMFLDEDSAKEAIGKKIERNTPFREIFGETLKILQDLLDWYDIPSEKRLTPSDIYSYKGSGDSSTYVGPDDESKKPERKQSAASQTR